MQIYYVVGLLTSHRLIRFLERNLGTDRLVSQAAAADEEATQYTKLHLGAYA